MEWGLVTASPAQRGAGAIFYQKRGRGNVSSQYCKMEETVAIFVGDIQVTLVTDQGVSYGLITIEQSKVEWNTAMIITLI